MKLDGISSFVAVAEEGSISGAARTLRLSKSVVSERLAELERSLGATLLHRTTRRVSVTEDGAAFLERAKRILREVSEAAADLSERRGTLGGPIRIAAPVTFGRMHLGPALYPFLAANPEIEMSLELDDRRVDIASDVYDGVVRHGAIDDSRLMVWRLAPSRRVLVASEAYLSVNGMPATTTELAAHKGLFYTNRGVADWRFLTPGGIEIVRARIGFRVNNGDMLRDAAIAGLGIALLPLFIARTGHSRWEAQDRRCRRSAGCGIRLSCAPRGSPSFGKTARTGGSLESVVRGPALLGGWRGLRDAS
ncbi:DNA-binding transcriptional LysR family regulator [Rhizobium pusense]|jgi:DNA-binding transcriptional LysR family regulator|nr:DNA-binding transcriptional LysR family regulator [Agrobacterium pusense]